MNYSIPIILSLAIIIFLVCFLLFANGVIKIPEIKTETPVSSSKIDEVFKELESMSASEIQKLKIRLEKILKKQDFILPVLP
jgi:outer membrane lipoprotein-sorting protein